MKVAYVNNPYHPISILLIGAGGNGSKILDNLAAINYDLLGYGKAGIDLTCMDYDIVTDFNVGRQSFFPSEVGDYKSVTLISRINRKYGFNWKSSASPYESQKLSYNVIITAVDSMQSRFLVQEQWANIKKPKDAIEAHYTQESPIYWLDMGNRGNIGQVVLASKKDCLPSICEMYPDSAADEHEDDMPSCSLAESRSKQGLFVNSWITQVAADLLHDLFMKDEINWRGAFINTSNHNIKRIQA